MGRVSDLLKSWPCGFVGDELVDQSTPGFEGGNGLPLGYPARTSEEI